MLTSCPGSHTSNLYINAWDSLPSLWLTFLTHALNIGVVKEATGENIFFN